VFLLFFFFFGGGKGPTLFFRYVSISDKVQPYKYIHGIYVYIHVGLYL